MADADSRVGKRTPLRWTAAQLGGSRSLVTVNRDHVRTGRTQFLSLELLRVIASLMIIIFHAHSISSKHATVRGLPYFDLPIAWNSCIELFFTMSGFLMIHMSRSLYGSSAGVRNFALRRITRTPPLYYIYTAALTIIFLLVPALSSDGPLSLQQVLGSFLFMPMDRRPVIAIGWTLQFEAFFYLVIGLSIFCSYRVGWKIAVFVLIALACIGQLGNFNTEPLLTWTDAKMLDFVIGIFVAVAYHSGVTLSKLARWLAAAVGLVLIFSLRHFTDHGLLRAQTLGLGVGCVIAAATLSDQQWKLGRLQALVHELSNQTYTMYLCHIVLLKCLEVFYFKLFSGVTSHVAFIIFGTVYIVVVSRGLYLIGEKPLTHYLRRLVKPAPSVAGPRVAQV